MIVSFIDSYTAPRACQQNVKQHIGAALEIVGSGLHFGYRNGMNPRGILMHEGALAEDGVLRGAMRLRGIEFKWPAGAKPPRVRFELTKKE